MITDTEKIYVTEEEGKLLSINYDYKQVWHHKGKRNIAEYVIIKDFERKDDIEKKIALEILVFMRDFCFATKEQLETLLTHKELPTDNLDAMLETFVSSRIANFFIMAKYDTGTIPDDAFRIYCLDCGGVYILSHFSTTDCVSWVSTDSVRSAELVVKYLTTNKFYLELLRARGKDLSFFKPIHTVNIGRRDMRFSGEFQVMQGYTPHTFILESVRSYDLPVMFSKKVHEQISTFIMQKHWEKYYKMPPTFIFIAENEQDALQIAEIFYRCLKYDQFRIITDDVLKAGFDNVIVYKYIPESPNNPEARLAKVRSGMFSRS